MIDESIVLQPVHIHYGNSHLNSFVEEVKVVKAPEQVLSFITGGDVMRGGDWQQQLVAMVANGYHITILEPEYRAVSLLEYLTKRGVKSENNGE